MNKRNITIILAAVLAILSIYMLIADKDLSIKSKEVTIIYHCGGLKTYNTKVITKDDLKQEDMLCMAYYQINEKNMVKKEESSTTTNEQDVKICKVGENVTLATSDENESICEYTSFSKETLNSAYETLFGAKIDDFNNFYLSDTKSCYLEGEEYYCGNSEHFNLSLGSNSKIYRFINSAKKKLNGDIIINDYFLRVSENNKCYGTTENNNEIAECSKELETISSEEISVNFVKKYGVEYTTLENVFSQSDFISIHAPLTGNTVSCIDYTLIKKMKPSAFLANASRGGIILENDLLRALNENLLRGAALDVFENEPYNSPNMDNPFSNYSNQQLITTPHMAACTYEAVRRIGKIVKENVLDILNNRIPRHNIVNHF